MSDDSTKKTIADAGAAFRQLTGSDVFLGGEAPQELQDAWEVFIGAVLAVTSPDDDRRAWIAECLKQKRALEGQRAARMIQEFESRGKTAFMAKNTVNGILKRKTPDNAWKKLSPAEVRIILERFDPLFLKLTDEHVKSAQGRHGVQMALATLCCSVGAMGKTKTANEESFKKVSDQLRAAKKEYGNGWTQRRSERIEQL